MQATQNIEEFIAAQELTMESVGTDRNPHMDADTAWAIEASHYLITIKRGNASIKTHYSMGSAHTSGPDLAMVLDSLASDAASVENAPDFLDWAEEMGYDSLMGAKQARTTHAVIRAQAGDLRVLLGSDAYDALLWNVERS